MDTDNFLGLIKFLFFVFVVFIIALGCIKITKDTCYNEWKDSGMNIDFSIMGGCRLQQKDGTWIPDHAIRYLGAK